MYKTMIKLTIILFCNHYKEISHLSLLKRLKSTYKFTKEDIFNLNKGNITNKYFEDLSERWNTMLSNPSSTVGDIVKLEREYYRHKPLINAGIRLSNNLISVNR